MSTLRLIKSIIMFLHVQCRTILVLRYPSVVFITMGAYGHFIGYYSNHIIWMTHPEHMCTDSGKCNFWNVLTYQHFQIYLASK